MPDLSKLTPRQRDVYRFLQERAFAGLMPTIREIGERLAIRSPNGVMCPLDALEEKGFISREGKAARAIMLTDPPMRGSLPFYPLHRLGSGV